MKHSTRLRLTYLAGDYLTVNIGWIIFNTVRFFSLPLGYQTSLQSFLLHDPNILLGQVLVPLMLVAMYAISGFYNNVTFKSRFDDLRNTAIVSLTGMLLV